MSLKAVHLVFVTALTALTLGSGLWLLHEYKLAPDETMKLWFGCLSCAASVAVVVYGRYFLKKLKHVSYL